MKCDFYVKTYSGKRCVLMSLEDWKKWVREGKLEYCLNIGFCPLALRVKRLSKRIKRIE